MSNDRNDSLKNNIELCNEESNGNLLTKQFQNFQWTTCAVYRKEKFNELLSKIGHQHSTYSSGGGYRYYKCKNNHCPAKLRVHSKKDKDEIFVFVRQSHTCDYNWEEIFNGDGVVRLDNLKKENGKKKIVKSDNSNERKRRRKSDDLSNRKKNNTVNDKMALSFNCIRHIDSGESMTEPSSDNETTKKRRKTKKNNEKEIENNDSIVESMDESMDCNKNNNMIDVENYISSSRSTLGSSSSRDISVDKVFEKVTRPKRKSAIKAMETKILPNGKGKNDDDDFEDSDDDDYDEGNFKSSDEEDDNDEENITSNGQPTTLRRFQPYTMCHVNLKKFCGFCMKDDDSEDHIIQCTCCKMKVHEHCYYVKNTFQPDSQRIVSPWFCNECLSDSELFSCIACHENHGPMKQTENGWIHGFCALYNNNIYEGLVDNLEGPFYSTKVAIIKKKSRCTFCENSILSCIGFTIQCEADKCNVKYHPMCGLKYGATFNIFPDDGYRNLSITHCPLHSTSEAEKSKSYSIYHTSKIQFEKQQDIMLQKKSALQESQKKSFLLQKKLMDSAYKEWVNTIKDESTNCSVIPISNDFLNELIDKESNCQPNIDLSKSFDAYILKKNSPIKEITTLDKKCNSLLSGLLQNIVTECLSLTKTANITIAKVNNKLKLTKITLSDSISIMTQIYDQLFAKCDDTVMKVIEARKQNVEEEVIEKEIKFIKSFFTFKKGYLKCKKNNCQEEDFVKRCMINLYKCLHHYINYFGSQE